MVSVIMPIYNAERFLATSIQSVLNQTFKDFELICIDDGSDDLTERMVNEFIKIDKRIKLYKNITNKGAAYSRNKGIQLASGEYLLFMDSDDYIIPELLYETVKCAEEHHSDIVFFEYAITRSERIFERYVVDRTENYYRIHCNSPINVLNVSVGCFSMWHTAPWNKLYRKRFIINNNLSFQNLTSQNDVYFVIMSYLKAESIVFLRDNRAFIHNRDHDSSIRITNNIDVTNGYRAYKRILEELIDADEKPRYVYAYFKCYTALLRSIQSKMGKDLYEYLLKNEKESLKKYDDFFVEGHNLYPQLSTFIDNSYESGWFLDENRVSMIMRDRNNDLWHKFGNNRSVVIWGCGRNGRALLKIADKLGIEYRMVVDNNADIIGSIYQYMVIKPSEIEFDSIKGVIITMNQRDLDVERFLDNNNVEYCYLVDYI